MHTLDELGNVIGKQLGLPHLPGHFQTIVYSFGIFTVVYLVSALTSPFVAPKTYPKLSRRTKHSWNVHTVSMAHAVVIGPMAAHRLLTLPEVGSFEKAFGWNESMGLLHGIAVGFVWDTIESVLAQVEVGFIIHGLQRPFMAFYGPSALVWEISTPFLNSKIQIDTVTGYLDKLQMTGGLLQAVNGIILLGVFFAVRVCYGLYMVCSFFSS
ncbi:TLC domain protein [Rhizoctonia solani AG-3 Rhs1AP]|uniref:TLC domain protein n=2 Tax=Rhizoctonia solani AG-3 TaxID=1086053 RepID=A0A074S4X1_9AGAM|nr:TLC domain protein [Rhizoctonia solani AG-3 Rhs1AP]KEP54456.1 TLC domain protein [Rhizoctonia solani 123E]